LSFDASVYAFKLRHGIVEQQDSTGAEFFVNSGSIKENGAEVWVEAKIIRNKNSLIKDLSISNSFTYQPYKFNSYLSGTKNYAGNRETGVPKYIDVITLDMNASTGIYFNANANFTSSIPLTDANDIYADAYKLLQLKLGYKNHFNNTMLDFYFGIDNLLNEKYSLGNDLNAIGGRYFNAAPRRNYFAGVRINF
ncbi:MAG TPA: TonB-dependent receptor, partial [Parafilimonas sp.]|nr:TonB-dependent receptor [Parafilimonas sp.]